MALGEVGRVGVAIDSIDDMRRLFDGIPLDRVTTSMTINATAPILLALYLAVAEEQGVPWEKVGGTIQNDILKEYAARGTYIYPPGPSMKLVTDVIEFCSNEVPRWNTISISGYHIREAGSHGGPGGRLHPGQGPGLRGGGGRPGARRGRLRARGCRSSSTPTTTSSRRSPSSGRRGGCGRSCCSERFAPKDERSLWLRFHTQTAGSTLTAQQPDNNVVRTTIQALAAVLRRHPERCTPTPSTRRWGCRPRPRPGWPCGPSR